MSRAEIRSYEQEAYRFRIRVAVVAVFAILLFCILAARFVYLQVLLYDHYHTLAENNRISIVPVTPARGVIMDRNGIVLAHNFSAYTLEVIPNKIKNMEATIEALSKIVELSPRDRKRFKKLLEDSRNFESLPIRTRLTEMEVARFAVNLYRFPGVEIKARLFRHYPQGELAAHAIGYISRINEKDLEQLEEEGQLTNYRGTDHFGKTGIEQSLERVLHGTTGLEQVETDAGGRAIRSLSRSPPVSGNNIYLSLDSRLQRIAENAFGDYRGSLVAIEPATGEVLALVSRPGFDPNLFVDGIDQVNWDALNNSLDKPLNNRALRGQYPPGSTFKPFMALGALALNKRSPSYSIYDPGFFTLPGSSHRYRDWKAGGHGMVDLAKSIIISCDIYYYGLAVDMGIENLHKFNEQFGFGRRTGIDIEGELPGLLPSPAWKRKRFKQPWYPGETVITGIGQGYMLTTPLQLAVGTSIIANKGIVYKPRLVKSIQDSTTRALYHLPPESLEKVEISAEHWDFVRQAMVGVTSPGGTAARIGLNSPYKIAGKTGTAQVVGIKQTEKYVESKVKERHRDHALFIAFAPAEDPKIAVAVLVENGGHGGSTAAPIAKIVTDYYLLGKMPPATGIVEEAEDGQHD